MGVERNQRRALRGLSALAIVVVVAAGGALLLGTADRADHAVTTPSAAAPPSGPSANVASPAGSESPRPETTRISPSPGVASATATPTGMAWVEAPSDQFGGTSFSTVVPLGTGFLAIGSPIETVTPEGAAPHATLWQSDDALHWRLLPDSPAFAGSAAGSVGWQDVVLSAVRQGTGYVAVGMQQEGDGSAANAAAWTSADGHSWARATVDGATGNTMDHVVATDMGYVAVGTAGYSFHAGMQGGTAIWTSIDGRRWSRLGVAGEPPHGVLLGAPVRALGRWFAAAERSFPVDVTAPPPPATVASIWQSKDGVHWDPLASGPPPGTVAALAWDGTTLAAAGNRQIGDATTPWSWTTPDAATWTEAPLPLPEPAGANGAPVAMGIVAGPTGFTALGTTQSDTPGLVAWSSVTRSGSGIAGWTPFPDLDVMHDINGPTVQSANGEVFVAGPSADVNSAPRLLVLRPNGAFLAIDAAVERARTAGNVPAGERLLRAELLPYADLGVGKRDPAAIGTWVWNITFVAPSGDHGSVVTLAATDGRIVSTGAWMT